jgi:hypothetical protein
MVRETSLQLALQRFNFLRVTYPVLNLTILSFIVNLCVKCSAQCSLVHCGMQCIVFETILKNNIMVALILHMLNMTR